MKNRVPSPALVISIISLVVACSATGYAATVISNSSQVKRGAINGTDIKNKSVKGGDIGSKTIQSSNLSKSALKSLGGGGGGGNDSAIEVTRKSGPENQPGNQNIKVVDMTLGAGAYIITAKVTQQAFPNTGLLAQPGVSIALGHCKLDAAGDVDDSLELIAANQRSAAATHVMQVTRTLGAGSVVQIICDAGLTWRTSNATIIAQKVGSVTKTDSP
jgi:hypothetical protein